GGTGEAGRTGGEVASPAMPSPQGLRPEAPTGRPASPASGSVFHADGGSICTPITTLHTFKKMVTARSLRGHLYWRSTDGEVVGQNELRFFTLDEKVLRTLAALDAKAR